MKISFYTLGCKVNQYETNAMMQKCRNENWEIVDWKEKADVYIINTCTVTNIADSKSRQMIRQAKKRNPDSLVIACGCYVENIKKSDELINLGIDGYISNAGKTEIVETIKEKYGNIKKENKEKVEEELNKFNGQFKIIRQKEKIYPEFGVIDYTNTNRAFIKIEDGCENFCTYCIIPYVRGKIISRDKENILYEIKALSEKGIKEVVLTGIHLASYGKERNDGFDLIELIKEIEKIDEIKRIRLGSIEPKYFSKENIERLKPLNKLCHQFHLSLQSANNNVLKNMNRKYTIEEFLEITKNLKKAFSDVILTTDVIVGFPKETDEDFKNTVENLKKIGLYKIHTFKYSKREGTIASKMEGQIAPEIKEERSKEIIKISDDEMYKINESYVGKKETILVEELKNGQLIGHTSNYILVKVNAKKMKEPEKYINSFIDVKIIKPMVEHVIAEMI